MRECCHEPTNLKLQPRDLKRPGVSVQQCRVCGARHIEMVAEAGHYLTVGTSV